MDMNWQAMLRGAASVSFEKDIEVHAAAGNDDCSCVDLPKAQIRELSKKILHLPYQGIAMKDYLRTELKEDSAVSSAGKSRAHIAFRRLGKAIAVATITLTLLFSTAMAANAQFRKKVIAWVVEIFENYSIFELQSDGEHTQAGLQSYQPTYLPDGAELQNTVELPEFIIYKYEMGNSDYFNIQLSQPDTRTYVDAENADIESLDIGGVTGYFFIKDGLNYVCFERDRASVSVYGALHVDELIKIAAGITKK